MVLAVQLDLEVQLLTDLVIQYHLSAPSFLWLQDFQLVRVDQQLQGYLVVRVAQLDLVVQAIRCFQDFLAILVDPVAQMNLLRQYTPGDQIVL